MMFEQIAREYALQHHGQQQHGCLDISDHLKAVSELVRVNFGQSSRKSIINIDEAVSAAWLHDVLEDTNATAASLSKIFPESIVDTVKRLTDSRGKNRRDRHLRTYWNIRDCPVATLIKLCDRHHNQERSLNYGERWIAMYNQEFERFSFSFWRPEEYTDLWTNLFHQQKRMQKFMEF